MKEKYLSKMGIDLVLTDYLKIDNQNNSCLLILVTNCHSVYSFDIEIRKLIGGVLLIFFGNWDDFCDFRQQ